MIKITTHDGGIEVTGGVSNGPSHAQIIRRATGNLWEIHTMYSFGVVLPKYLSGQEDIVMERMRAKIKMAYDLVTVNGSKISLGGNVGRIYLQRDENGKIGVFFFKEDHPYEVETVREFLKFTHIVLGIVKKELRQLTESVPYIKPSRIK